PLSTLYIGGAFDEHGVFVLDDINSTITIFVDDFNL
ncbi:MAG: hypothetical protein RL736_969, partial [Pseudomonadota bacterium]